MKSKNIKKAHLCSTNFVSMKKLIYLFFSFIFFSGFAVAQKVELFVKSSDQGLYLEHNVVAKESYYAIGRKYNVTPKELADFNKLALTKGLLIDQKIKVPLQQSNFVQDGKTGAPVYYQIANNESLGAVSKKNNNVSLSNLRFWNNLKQDKLKDDSKLIVGFLKGTAFPAVTISGSPKKEEVIAKVEKNPEEEKPVEVKEPEKKEPEKKVPVVAKQPEPVVEQQNDTPAPSDFGYFQTHFEKQVKTSSITKNETVTSGIFKTASGWEDAKFYLLIDNVSPGTIIRVINPINNKSVFAKVLGEMSGIRQNAGLDIRISNAAAAALDVKEEDKFIVKVYY